MKTTKREVNKYEVTMCDFCKKECKETMPSKNGWSKQYSNYKTFGDDYNYNIHVMCIDPIILAHFGKGETQ